MLDPITRASWMVRNLSRNDSKENLDRFIPNRSASKLDFVLEKGWKDDGDPDSSSPSKVAYRRRLKEVFNLQDSRILAYKRKPPALVDYYPKDGCVAVRSPKPVRRQRHIPETAARVLDAPDLSDDYYVNLLDWGSKNFLAIALRNTVHVWNANIDSASELVEVDDDTGPVTNVRWAPDGNLIAVGFQNSQVQLLDSTTSKVLRVLRGHQARVGSLAWNEHVLTTGSMDSSIINNDVRVRDHIVEFYQGHYGQVCGLNWSSTGQQLASGGNDNLVYIWDRSMASTRGAQTQFLHCFEDHKAAVRAVAWCPFQHNLLASGGGAADKCIRFWNSQTGTCLSSVDTGSRVCSLLWSNTDRELLSSHDHRLTLWKYPSMVKMTELAGHESRVLYTAQSPSGLVASAAGGVDERLRIWKVFGDPKAAKPAKREALHQMPFAHCSRIR